MPISTVHQRYIDGISDLISRVRESCGIDGWRQWADAWLDQSELRSGSAIEAAGRASAVSETAESPHNEIASAAFEVADAAARILLNPNEAADTLDRCRAKVDHHLEAAADR